MTGYAPGSPASACTEQCGNCGSHWPETSRPHTLAHSHYTQQGVYVCSSPEQSAISGGATQQQQTLASDHCCACSRAQEAPSTPGRADVGDSASESQPASSSASKPAAQTGQPATLFSSKLASTGDPSVVDTACDPSAHVLVAEACTGLVSACIGLAISYLSNVPVYLHNNPSSALNPHPVPILRLLAKSSDATCRAGRPASLRPTRAITAQKGVSWREPSVPLQPASHQVATFRMHILCFR